jgi:exonuclease SbcD
MKILHTSDWHLGRGLGNYDLFEDQEKAVNFIVEEAISRKVDALVIAGDVFDRGTPPPKSIKLLNSALTRLFEAGITSIVTAGNHDSAERLTAYANLLKENVYICGSLTDTGKPIVLEDVHGPVAFYPITFLYIDQALEAFSDQGHVEIARSHQAVYEHVMKVVAKDFAALKKKHKSARSVVIAHSFVTTYGTKSKREIVNGVEVENDAVVSESERDISVGGVQTISADTFDGASYVALGHLHGPQRINTQKSKALIRYSGSPIRYSLSEKNHKKSFAVVTLGADSSLEDSAVEIVPIPQTRGMVRVEDTCEQILGGTYANHRDDFVELIITDKSVNSIELAKARGYFNFVLSSQVKGFDAGRLEDFANVTTQKMHAIDVISTFFEKVSGAKPEGEALQFLSDVYEEVRNSGESTK